MYYQEARVNRKIRAQKLKVVTDSGEFLGILSISDALREAENRGLDLVEISPNSEPPVAKIMDHGKYCYEQKKHLKKNVNKSSLKEIKMRVNIQDHDITYKRKKLIEFLQDGHKVKVTVCFFGREISHKELGHSVINRMLSGIEAVGKLEFPPKLEGQNLSTVVVAA